VLKPEPSIFHWKTLEARLTASFLPTLQPLEKLISIRPAMKEA
jgi:hypothetical protein